MREIFLGFLLFFVSLSDAPARFHHRFPTPTPTPTPTPGPGLTAPPQSAAQGFSHLGFDQEPGSWDIGYGTTGHKWNSGLWWEPVPSAAHYQIDSSGILTIVGTNVATELCTQYHDASGGTYFKGGYFEAYMRCTDWSAFWLFCADRPFVWADKVLPSNPLTWTNEIDIIETDPGTPNLVYCTLHKNTSGDSLPDAQNYPNAFNVGKAVVGQWHIFGCLWTQNSITWYLDNVPVVTVSPYASTWQPVQLILTAQPGGVNGSASTVTPPTTQVSWVRVWQ